MSSDSAKKTIGVALGVCLVCSVFVSSATVALSSKQEENKKLDKIQNILEAADLKTEDNPEEINNIYKQKIKTELINLETGEVVPEDQYTKELMPENFDIKKVIADPDLVEPIPPEKDLARIKRKPKYMLVYMVLDENGEVSKYILPIYGKGLWSTLYGFLALNKDLKTISGITFYEHGETPGLGGEVDNPRWKQLWKGKKAFNDNWEPVIRVIKGKVDPSDPKADHTVDGLSGATLTTRGVDHLVRFWLSDDGYGNFLKTLRGKKNEQV